MVIFLSFFQYLLVGFPLEEKIFLFPSTDTLMFIYISLDEWISIYASVKFVISIYFNARHKEHWELLQSGSCVLLMCDHLFFIFLSSSLLSSLIRCSSLIISSACRMALELAISFFFFPHWSIFNLTMSCYFLLYCQMNPYYIYTRIYSVLDSFSI